MQCFAQEVQPSVFICWFHHWYMLCTLFLCALCLHILCILGDISYNKHEASQREGELFFSTSGSNNSNNHGAFGVEMHWWRSSDGCLTIFIFEIREFKFWSSDWTFEFPLVFSLNSANSVTKLFVIYSKRVRTCHLLCNRPGCYHSAGKTYMWEMGPLNWPQFMLQWLIRFPEFAEFLFHLENTPLTFWLNFYLNNKL